MLEIVCVPVITTLVFALMEIYKRYIAKDKKVLVHAYGNELLKDYIRVSKEIELYDYKEQNICSY